jgi:hypothetical protein
MKRGNGLDGEADFEKTPNGKAEQSDIEHCVVPLFSIRL